MAEDTTTITGALENWKKFFKNIKLGYIAIFILLELLSFDITLQLFKIFNNIDEYVDTNGSITEDPNNKYVCINSTITNMFFTKNESGKFIYLQWGSLIGPLASSVLLYTLYYNQGFNKSSLSEFDDKLLLFTLICNTLYMISSLVIGLYLMSGKIRARHDDPEDKNNYIYKDDTTTSIYGLCMNDSCGTNYLAVNTLVNAAFVCKILTLLTLCIYIFFIPDTRKQERGAFQQKKTTEINSNNSSQ